MGSNATPKSRGEELPPFFIPARYKLLYKCLQDVKNTNRFNRKPMPEAVKTDFIA